MEYMVNRCGHVQDLVFSEHIQLIMPIPTASQWGTGVMGHVMGDGAQGTKGHMDIASLILCGS